VPRGRKNFSVSAEKLCTIRHIEAEEWGKFSPTKDMVMIAPSVVEQSCVLLDGITWETFERILHELGDNRGTRLAYDNGHLEIMSPSSSHEALKELLSDIAHNLVRALRVDFAKMGSTTFKRRELGRGFEPDQCFYIQRYEAIRERHGDLDFAQDPAPDLVIEIDITHRSLTKLPIYAALGVREVWRYTGARVLLYHCEAGEARLAEASRIFLGLSVQDMQRFLELRPTMIQPDWEDHIMAWAQQHITLAPLPPESC
jgi:Uma2 family endonuclease